MPVSVLAATVLIAPAVQVRRATALAVVAAARRQIGVTVRYVPDYVRISYPVGDVPASTGVCTDVVIRALRSGAGLDLQKLVHEDMRHHFSVDPNSWGRSSPDKNIDHRRVPNLQVFFRREGWELKLRSPFLPGDLVTCIVPKNLPHIMIVSDRRSANGRYLVIHNIGRGTQEEDCLAMFPITGHYRVQKR